MRAASARCSRCYAILHNMPGRERTTRERMIVSTALLVRERGARATSIDDVLAHSGAPRGSVYHHFPGGRDELLREATAYAGDVVARGLERGAGSRPHRGVRRVPRRVPLPARPARLPRGLPGRRRRHRIPRRRRGAPGAGGRRVRPLGRPARREPRRRRRRAPSAPASSPSSRSPPSRGRSCSAARAATPPRSTPSATSCGACSKPNCSSPAPRRPPSTERSTHDIRGADRRDRRDLASERLHPLRVQLRHRGRARRPHAQPDPRRQAPPGLPGLHVQQGDAARLLPERHGPADLAAAPPARRVVRGDRLGHGRRRDRGRVRPRARRSTVGSRSSTTGAAVRATTSAAPTAAPSCGPSARATARARWRRRRPARRGSTPSSPAATRAVSSSTPRSRCSSARTRGCRRASRGRASCSARSPRIPSAR